MPVEDECRAGYVNMECGNTIRARWLVWIKAALRALIKAVVTNTSVLAYKENIFLLSSLFYSDLKEVDLDL